MSEIDLGASTISSSTVFVRLFDNNMSTSEVDAVWIELDRVALFTSVSVTLDVNGNNAPPSSVSDSARLSLFLKGYFLIE